MAIPDYQSIMLPLLKFTSDEKEHHFRSTVNQLYDFFKLSEKERRERLPSGYDRIMDNRVGWAKLYLKKALLLFDIRRGYFKITQRGLDVLNKNPIEINVKFLIQFKEFVEFLYPKKEEIKDKEIEGTKKTPRELIDKGFEEIGEKLAQELLEKLRNGSPEFFEKVVVELLDKMGYGKGEHTGGPGDGGIDGIIYQDPLKIDKIYLQAKRYAENNIIGPNDIWKFIGVLENRGASKGVFITTSRFHQNVDEIISTTHKNIVIIDGEKLVKLMKEYNLGVSVEETFFLKEIDSDYFEE